MKLQLHAMILCALLLGVPAGAATWRADEGFEPDTLHDDSRFAWSEPPGSNTSRVYFNGYVASFSPSTTNSLNPNVGLLQSQVEPVLVRHKAILGVWSDCNRDGYIGDVETAMREYPAALLENASVCEARSGPSDCYRTLGPGESCGNWPANGYNNYNGWVTELIPIGNAAVSGADARVILDPAALVWVDRDLPDAPAVGTTKRGTQLLTFATMARDASPAGGPTGPAGNADDVGTALVCTSSCRTEWDARTGVVNIPATVRGSVFDGFEPAAATFWTYYARVGEETLAASVTTPGGTGTYGAAQCGSHTSGAPNGWECDPARWRSAQNPDVWPGVTYALRDVDCYDGTLTRTNGVWLGAGLPYFGRDPCHH